ncbi:programmed cell death 1 ligand 1-like [Micropterus salmoides]|uniref:programmed cell death 1 ligand 1-like n=1 Tax=Micropterus salmoides TaxID=27706 RepID=UPI0018EBB069|nr:programmed cell death 1 ligand 1-like [Micropterus salmoides]
MRLAVFFCFMIFTLLSASGDVVQVKPGDNVTLPCQAGDVFIRAVEWTRPDLEPDYVVFHRDGLSDPTHQHPSFKDRVQLVDRELKDGDVSLLLKNVSSNDAGTYECRVAQEVQDVREPLLRLSQSESSSWRFQGPTAETSRRETKSTETPQRETTLVIMLDWEQPYFWFA